MSRKEQVLHQVLACPETQSPAGFQEDVSAYGKGKAVVAKSVDVDLGED